MTVTLQVYDEIRSAILFDLNDPTGANAGTNGYTSTKLSNDPDLGSPQLQSATVEAQDIDATYSAFSKRATASVKASVWIAGTSYENLVTAVGTLAQYLTQGCVLKYISGTNTYFIDVLPSPTPALVAGQEDSLYGAAGRFQQKIDLEMVRQPYLRSAGLAAATNVLSNATMIRDIFGSGMPTGWAGAFDPGAVSGLLAWYDFGDAATLFTDTGRTTPVSADGQLVKGVTDKSGVANHLSQATTGPAYKTGIKNGRSVVRFANAANEFLAATLTQAQPVTGFIVGKITTSGGASNNTFYDSAAAGTRAVVYRKATTGEWTMYSGTAEITGAASDTSWHVIATTFNGASSKLWVDGGAAVTGNPGSQAYNTSIRLGADWNGVSRLQGDEAEFLLYNSALSVANVNVIGRALAARWGTSWATAT